jgi:hypothetical protein
MMPPRDRVLAWLTRARLVSLWVFSLAAIVIGGAWALSFYACMVFPNSYPPPFRHNRYGYPYTATRTCVLQHGELIVVTGNMFSFSAIVVPTPAGIHRTRESLKNYCLGAPFPGGFVWERNYIQCPLLPLALGALALAGLAFLARPDRWLRRHSVDTRGHFPVSDVTSDPK